MGFLKGLFGNSNGSDEAAAGRAEKDTKKVPWLALTTVAQLNEIVERSKTKTQVVFKHSTTCGISRMVMNMFNSNYDLEEGQMDFYYLDLHAYREVSNETGYLFQVMHQSPQLLIVRNGTAVAHASHGAITELDLHKYV
ncbi:bacillithiol system redox-active protein YtxJ [Aggregatimonas sangjinii]|uniref:Bacillithiol system redox-active protein YtxJ n=1 Tax=Aggregatimonas sangjinii TaxID=2583587 RepID=A0A5B7SNZ5_9FLAO|nr:bacillithiol system redox-active protein YtxJ [Aggregatimonas sangjinii]QCX00237.1 bacillithiol system redox-active protein YtxJ [Aggregatimonas sangjinii]